MSESLQLLKCIWRRKKSYIQECTSVSNVKILLLIRHERLVEYTKHSWRKSLQTTMSNWTNELKKIKKKDAIVMNMREIMVERKKIFYPISFNTAPHISSVYGVSMCVFLTGKNKFYRLKTFKLFQNICSMESCHNIWTINLFWMGFFFYYLKAHKNIIKYHHYLL